LVSEIVKQESTPAHDLIGYFAKLDSIDAFKEREEKDFNSLYKKYNDNKFIQRIISLRTQMYLNTHYVDASVEQYICSTLKISYMPRLKKIG
jgi:NADH:ubiquinone oxidoreductase subunit E